MNSQDTKLLRAILSELKLLNDRLGVERPKQKTVDLGNDLVVSVTRNAIEHTVTSEDSLLPRQVQAESLEPEPVNQAGGGKPFRADEDEENGKPYGPLLTEAQLANFKGFRS